ncbi:TA system VapC family ribonuclease toxin [uncultured Friedmanniella sp.]|uniref:TA system VapC family ribonuclease toxin n=1 Tax=uncultured Friedmanniella sp. TaxID=335381 RepID=UPI0035CA2A99
MNVLVAAYRSDAPQHEQARSWLEEAVNAGEPVGLSDAVVTGYVRVVTHPRVFDQPTPLATALGHVRTLLGSAGTLRVLPGRRHWEVVEELCTAGDARGNLVADAAHAATALEAGATWVTFDRDFARFPGLSWRSP